MKYYRKISNIISSMLTQQEGKTKYPCYNLTYANKSINQSINKLKDKQIINKERQNVTSASDWLEFNLKVKLMYRHCLF